MSDLGTVRFCNDFLGLNTVSKFDTYFMPRVDELMDRVLRPQREYAAAYLDNIIVHSDSWESHLCRLQAVADPLRDAELTANPHKFKLGYAEV